MGNEQEKGKEKESYGYKSTMNRLDNRKEIIWWLVTLPIFVWIAWLQSLIVTQTHMYARKHANPCILICLCLYFISFQLIGYTFLPCVLVGLSNAPQDLVKIRVLREGLYLRKWCWQRYSSNRCSWRRWRSCFCKKQEK